MQLQIHNENSLNSARQAQHRFRPAARFYSVLMEILYALRAIHADIKPPPSIKTGVPLTKREAARSLGLTVQKFNRKVENKELVEGRHYAALDEDVIYLADKVVDYLFEDRSRSIECASKPPGNNPESGMNGNILNYKRKSH